ncbi:MAG: LuxR C-terminal-related transcriptional regulator [Ilumatobacteraceae bacterium]
MLSGRIGLSPVMVGRARAFARLAGIVDAADVMTGDQAAVALVSGEAGIGKTRLVRELVQSLPGRSTTLGVIAQPGSMSRPLDAVASLVEPGLAGDELAGAVLDTVAEAIGRGPVVLVVEDLHWIDAASANLVDRMAQQPWPNLVIIATYRPNDLSRGQPGGELVLRLERRHAVEQVRLERLDRTEVNAMVTAITTASGAHASSAFVEALHRRSGGIPFVVEELMRVVGPRAMVSDLLDAELPWSLEEAVRQQVEGLDHGRRRVVEALAVYGRAASFESMLTVTDASEEDLLGDLRRLVATGVVVEVSDDQFWFTHALVADAIVHQLLGRERRRLHERCFEAVRRAPLLDHSSLAFHAQGADRHDEVPAIARKGAAGYLDKGHTFSALRLAAQGLAEAPNDPELLAIATEAAWRLDFAREALGTATRWSKVAVEVPDRIEALRFVSRIHYELDEEAASLVALGELEALADGLDDVRCRGVAAAAIAQVHMIAGRSIVAVEWAERALADARAAGDPMTEARALVELAGAMIGTRPRGEALEGLDAALDAARRSGDAVLLTRAINNGLEIVPAHSAQAAELRVEMQDVSSRVGFDKLGTATALLWEFDAAFGAGDLPTLRRVSAEGSQWWTRYGAERSWVTAAQVGYALEEGRLADAAEMHAGFAAGCPGDRRQHYLRLDIALAAGRGDREAGLALYEELLTSPMLYDAASTINNVFVLVEDLLTLGVTPAEVRSRVFDGWLAEHPSNATLRAHADGLLELAAGDHSAAAAALSAVLVEPDPCLAKPVVGSLRTALAEALLGVGDRAGALVVVRRAIDDDLARWPGVRRDRAEALARRLQGASSRVDGDLTAREREVAALLADGLTNGQLAERLFISPKTAAVHVSNILAKLGLSSRAEIAAWAVRHGIAREIAS